MEDRPTPPSDATLLLRAMSRGDEGASAELLEVVYAELRRLAGGVLRGEREGHTLQPTALVHEAWLRLVDQRVEGWEGRAHFLGVASLAMRRVVVDHARARLRDRRGGGAAKEPLPTQLADPDDAYGERLDVLALHEGLERLAAQDTRAAKVVELRYFGGLTEPQVAEVLGASEATVVRDWRAARAWLLAWMERQAGS